MISITEATSVCFSKYFDFNGRAQRSEFWWFYLVTTIAMVAGRMVDAFLANASGEIGFVELAVTLAVIIPVIAATTRRLHDSNLSGWWQLISLTVILIPLVIYWLARKGTVGENRFGPDPLSQNAGGFSMVPPSSPGQVK